MLCSGGKHTATSKRVKLRQNPGGLILQAANVGISSGSWTEPPSCLCRVQSGQDAAGIHTAKLSQVVREVTVGHSLPSPFHPAVPELAQVHCFKACASVCSDTSVFGRIKKENNFPVSVSKLEFDKRHCCLRNYTPRLE